MEPPVHTAASTGTIGPSSPSRITASSLVRSELTWFLLVAVGIRVVLLLADAHPRFFLGDSEAYLYSAKGYFPADRSWLYGRAANGLFRLTHALESVIIAQSLLSAILCVAIAALARCLGARRRIAWALLVLLSLDPLLLYYDRSMLTDAPGAAVLWTGVALAAMALVRGGALRWAGAALLLLLAVTLRTAVLPLVLAIPCFALATGVVRAYRAGSVRPLIPGAALLGGVAAGLAAYATLTGALTGSPAALNPKAGYFLLATVSPILAPQDLAGLGIADPERLLRETRHEEFARRNSQIYSPRGLCSRMEEELGSWQATSPAAARAARRAILRDPLGWARLVATSAWEYLAPRQPDLLFDTSFGLRRPLPATMVDWLGKKVRNQIVPTMVSDPSLVLSWLSLSRRGLQVLAWLALLLPLTGLVRPARGREAYPALLLVAICCFGQTLSAFSFDTECTQRYLVPFVPPVLLLLAMSLERWLPSRGTEGT
jgi:hypothetical protein